MNKFVLVNCFLLKQWQIESIWYWYFFAFAHKKKHSFYLWWLSLKNTFLQEKNLLFRNVLFACPEDGGLYIRPRLSCKGSNKIFGKDNGASIIKFLYLKGNSFFFEPFPTLSSVSLLDLKTLLSLNCLKHVWLLASASNKSLISISNFAFHPWTGCIELHYNHFVSLLTHIVFK